MDFILTKPKRLALKGSYRDVIPFHKDLAQLDLISKVWQGEHIEIDLGDVKHFGIHLAAPFRAWIEGLKSTENSIAVTWPREQNVLHCLENIGLCHALDPSYMLRSCPTVAITHRTFTKNEKDAFYSWLDNDVLNGYHLSHLNLSTRQRIIGRLCDMYGNYLEHSDTQLPLVGCGQYYPSRQRLSLSISDWGVGFADKIISSVAEASTVELALRWAMARGNSTKPGDNNSGLGYYELERFCRNQQGWFHLVSDGGVLSTMGQPQDAYRFVATGHHPGATLHLTISTTN